ncbi:hypothetical protein V6N13_140721 [Hibiscus sabdariffa]
MDQSLITAARTGQVSDLYRIIQSDGNVLRRIVDTPLHLAAEECCIKFAMEVMNLKPSFARRLSQQGLSPIHIAVRKRHTEMALRFLEIDKDLVCVRGKKGKTPFHCVSKVGNADGLLDRFLEACPECIRDVTTGPYCFAHRGEKQQTDKHVTNGAGLTALGLAHQRNNRESITILHGCFNPKAKIVTQATLSPPGGVWQVENTTGSHDARVLGKSVMSEVTFLLLYVPTYVVFIVTFFLTLALLKPFPRGFRTALQVFQIVYTHLQSGFAGYSFVHADSA